jgi:hypothetical protein
MLALGVGIGLRLDRTPLRPSAAGLAGLAVGTVVNPYFPSNLEMLWAHLALAASPQLGRQVNYGAELMPLPPGRFVIQFGFFFGVIALAASVLYSRREELARLSDLLLMTLFGAALFVASTLSPRAVEYLAPACAIVLAGSAAALARPKLAWAMGLGLALQLVSLIPLLTRLPEPAKNELLFEALDSVPKGPSLTKVYNCEWYFSPYILYHRPDLAFVDILDPSFLLRVSPQKFLVRRMLEEGRVREPAKALAEVFGAKYVICAKSALVGQMAQDPGFTRLFPDRSDRFPAGGVLPVVYRVQN